MPNRVRVALGAILLLITASLSAATPRASIDTEGGYVTASGFPAGSTLIFYAIGLDEDGYASTNIYRRVTEQAADANGATTYQPTGGIPKRSIWIVVEEKPGGSGAAVVGLPAEYRTPPLGGHERYQQSSGTYNEVTRRAAYIDALYVDPTGRAWIFSGGPDADGNVTIHTADLKPVSGDPASTPPASYEAGGTLALVDSYEMEFSLTKITTTTLPGEAQ